MRKVDVVPYNESWPDKFCMEAKTIRCIDQSNIINIIHIGSTAVPNMAAKPVIDMLLIVRNLNQVSSEQLAGIGYEYHGENGIANRLFFSKGGENRTHHLHVVQFDNSNEIQRHVSLKEYLSNNDAKHKEYSDMKMLLAKKFPKDIENYIKGKNELVKKLEQESLVYAWERL